MPGVETPTASCLSVASGDQRTFFQGLPRNQGLGHVLLPLLLKGGLYTGQKKVALVDVETHDNPIPLESYTMRQGKVWAVICHPGKPFITINLKGCDN